MWQRGKSKYSNKASVCKKGHSHRSGLESSVCALLQLREKKGEIVIEGIEQSVYLTKARIRYIADFKCRDAKTCLSFYVESKGFETPEWKLKLRLYEYYGQQPLELWMGTAAKPFLFKTVFPKEVYDRDPTE